MAKLQLEDALPVQSEQDFVQRKKTEDVAETTTGACGGLTVWPAFNVREQAVAKEEEWLVVDAEDEELCIGADVGLDDLVLGVEGTEGGNGATVYARGTAFLGGLRLCRTAEQSS